MKEKCYREINRGLISLYWNIGKYVVSKIEYAGWGQNTVGELAEYIQERVQGLRGFSARNI